MHQDHWYQYVRYIHMLGMTLQFDVDFQSIQVHKYHNVHQYILRYIHRLEYWFRQDHRFESQHVVLEKINQ